MVIKSNDSGPSTQAGTESERSQRGKGVATRQRLLDAAMHLFARQGLAKTTVGEIESAAGMAPRSGALYKYFDSKDDLLAAGLEQHLDTVVGVEQQLTLRPLGDVRSELTMLGHWLLHELEVERDITHVLEREGDRVEELRERMRIDISDRGYRLGADVLQRWLPDLARVDAEAMAVGAIGGLINYKRSSWTFGHPPLGLEPDAVVTSWVDVWARLIASAKDADPR